VKRLILILCFLFFISSITVASEKVDICLKYKKEIGWSRGYSVKGTIIDGFDLNDAVGSFSRFNSHSTYVVVFWDKDQASIFELPAISFGSVPIFNTQVKDQDDRLWRIKEGHDFCN